MAMKRITGPDGLPYLIDTQEEEEDGEQFSDWANPNFPSAMQDLAASRLLPYPGMGQTSTESKNYMQPSPRNYGADASPFAGLQLARPSNIDYLQDYAATGRNSDDNLQATTTARGLLLRAVAANDDVGPGASLALDGKMAGLGRWSRNSIDRREGGYDSVEQNESDSNMGLLNRFTFPRSSTNKSVPVSFIQQSELYARTPSHNPLIDQDIDLNAPPSPSLTDRYMRFENGLGERAIPEDAEMPGQNKAWDEGLKLYDNPAPAVTLSDEEGEKRTARLLRSKLLQAREDSEKALAPVGMKSRHRPEEIAMAMGQDISGARYGMAGKDMQADRDRFNKNVDAELKQLDAMADREGYSAANRAMLKNTYVLARYDALTRENPDFFWTKLGIFAANTVRHGLVESHNSADALDGLGPTLSFMPGASGLLGGMSIREIAKLTRGMADDTLKGQIDVLKDVGGLSVMHKMYGSEAMRNSNLNGMSAAARESFSLQKQAEEARDRGDTKEFYRLQTAAAVQMGRHEQSNLQAMWDKPSMSAFSKVNAMLLKETGMALVHPDIYVGTNRDADKNYARLIVVPQGSEDLTSLENRVNIARNGFNTINEMRQTPEGNNLLKFHQGQLGRASRLVQPFLKPDWWKFNS
ncbi:hypothetical protein [Undibacterium pigrum]|uniref:Uncharacterized protein n=1 Tax=Undibacterium pigrum TaxID=401470 RepID=A0A318IJN4_9BURK|nr:hypothetical protein [Undibacterium pigrum]PXX33477.1 hypothetical protein DFR42_1336 [Undibacterium pigrum]